MPSNFAYLLAESWILRCSAAIGGFMFGLTDDLAYFLLPGIFLVRNLWITISVMMEGDLAFLARIDRASHGRIYDIVRGSGLSMGQLRAILKVIGFVGAVNSPLWYALLGYLASCPGMCEISCAAFGLFLALVAYDLWIDPDDSDDGS